MVPDYSTPNKKKRYVEAECRNILKATEKVNQHVETYLGGIYGIRRQKAILNYLDRAEKEFRTFGLASIVECFVRYELMPVNNYNNIDCDYDLRIGAALWILEKLRAGGKLGKAYDVIPDMSGDPDIMYLPIDFSHPCYDDGLIQSVIYVISNRYGGKRSGVITAENAERKEPDETYRRLLELLPAEDVERASSEFKTKVWELETRFMKCKGYYDREIDKTVREIERIKNASLPGPFANPRVSGGFSFPDQNHPADVARRGKDLLEQSDHFEMDFNRYLRMDRKAIRRETGSREVAEALSGFTVKNPYELCFALLYLMDTGDDIAWLMRSGCSLMLYVLKMLPWYEDQDDWTDEEWDAWEEEITYNRNGWMEQEKPEEQIDFYHEMHGGQNLAQVIYGLCRAVVPTGLHPFEADRKRLIEEGMEEDKARKITDIAELLFLYDFRATQSLGIDFSWMNGEGEEEEDDEEDQKGEEPVKLGGYWGKVAADLGMEGLSDNKAETEDENEDEDENEKLKEELNAAKKQLNYSSA